MDDVEEWVLEVIAEHRQRRRRFNTLLTLSLVIWVISLVVLFTQLF